MVEGPRIRSVLTLFVCLSCLLVLLCCGRFSCDLISYLAFSLLLVCFLSIWLISVCVVGSGFYHHRCSCPLLSLISHFDLFSSCFILLFTFVPILLSSSLIFVHFPRLSFDWAFLLCLSIFPRISDDDKTSFLSLCFDRVLLVALVLHDFPWGNKKAPWDVQLTQEQ